MDRPEEANLLASIGKFNLFWGNCCSNSLLPTCPCLDFSGPKVVTACQPDPLAFINNAIILQARKIPLRRDAVPVVINISIR